MFPLETSVSEEFGETWYTVTCPTLDEILPTPMGEVHSRDHGKALRMAKAKLLRSIADVVESGKLYIGELEDLFVVQQ